MRSVKYLLPAVVMAIVLSQSFASSGLSYSAGQSKYIPVTKYDPKRNADQDIKDSVQEAQRAHKRILLEVGGDWCSWCHTLDNFFDAHRELLELRDKYFVTVKINFSEENENKEVLSRYGDIPGYPHIFVLEADGKLLLSKNNSALESGKSYDLQRLSAFLKEWARTP